MALSQIGCRKKVEGKFETPVEPESVQIGRPRATFDAVVIGSGFGGSVVAGRLAEKGYTVLVLERGRRWRRDEYPSVTKKDWIWNNEHPEKDNGWFDIRQFDTISTVAGAGVGGGSLHYANVSLDAAPDLFDQGWPAEINFAEVSKYYPEVKNMLQAAPIPERQRSNRTKIMMEAAEKTGYTAIYKEVDLAVNFKKDWDYDSSQRPTITPEALRDRYCVHLGMCELGCPVNARNTLDMNYLRTAEDNHADIRPLHIVWKIEPRQEGYEVYVRRLENGQLLHDSVKARIVVLAGGSIGSTELLLRCRNKYETLPNIGPMLGRKWSSNANYLSFALHPNRDIYPTRGPTISAAIKFLGNDKYKGQNFVIEDGGFPDVLFKYRRVMENAEKTNEDFENPLHFLHNELDKTSADAPLKHWMPWFAQGRDEPIGKFGLRRKYLGICGPRSLHLSWDRGGARKVLDAIQEIHRKFKNVTGGTAIFQLRDALITPHPLGGCPMGDDISSGAVDHRGEVFGYRNLFVADGSIIPKPIGHNPSKTIAALSERIAEIIISEAR